MKEKHFMVKLSITVKSDDDGDFYINPTEGNVGRLIRESLRPYTQLPDLKIRKLEVLESQPI